jgi:hypothetical protein
MLFIQVLNRLMRLLDELFFAPYRDTKVAETLIIAANPRSGTTLLHRLLALDEETFTTFNLHHVLFPSISMHKLFRLLQGPFKVLSDWFYDNIFVRWEGMHRVELGEPEEDEALLFFSFVSGSIYILFPFFDEVRAPRFADRLPKHRRNALVRYYRNCVQRFLFATGRARGDSGRSGRVFLLKSVFFASRLEIMHEVFPDARIVYLIRDPYKTIPSFVSTFSTLFWKIHSPEIPENSSSYRQWARLGVDYYHYFQKRRQIFGSSLLTLSYQDLTTRPVEMIMHIYDYFGMTVRDSFKVRLESEVERNKGYKSGHTYSLERYGLSRDWIYRELKNIFDAYQIKQ